MHRRFKKGFHCVFEDIGRRYQFIQEQQQEYPVKTLCHILGVSESGYYAWCKREPSQRQVENERLTEQIAQAFLHG